MNQALALPDWLAPDPGAPLALLEMQCEVLFERILEWIASGNQLVDFIAQDQRDLDKELINRWIMRSPERRRRLREAKKIGCLPLEDKYLQVAAGKNLDGSESMQDVQRSTLLCNALWKLMATWDRETYGDVKKIDLTGSIDIRQALAEAETRVIEGTATVIIEQAAGDGHGD